jgi:hypothetical protein
MYHKNQAPVKKMNLGSKSLSLPWIHPKEEHQTYHSGTNIDLTRNFKSADSDVYDHIMKISLAKTFTHSHSIENVSLCLIVNKRELEVLPPRAFQKLTINNDSRFHIWRNHLARLLTLLPSLIVTQPPLLFTQRAYFVRTPCEEKLAE